MDFIEFLKQQRECYLKQLIEFYRERQSGAKEILLVLDNDEEERIFKLYRLDHYEQIDGEGRPTELGPNRYTNHPKILFKLGDLSIELNPFYWHGCDFVFEKEIQNIEWLKLWATKWIDVEDTNPIDANGFSGVIHNVTRPLQTNNGWQFTVDFGTASEESFNELLRCINERGIGEVRIGSLEMIQ